MTQTLKHLYSHRAKILQQLSWARYAYQQELKKEPGKINPDLLSYQCIKIKDLEDKLEGTNITIYHAEMQAIDLSCLIGYQVEQQGQQMVINFTQPVKK